MVQFTGSHGLCQTAEGSRGKTACLVWPNSWETAQDRLFVIFNRWFVFYALAAVAVLSDKKRSDNVQKRGKNEGLMCSSAETGSRHFHPCLGRVQMCRFSTWCACNWKQHLGGFWGEAGVNCANRKIKPTLSLWETAADSPCRPRTPVSSPSWLGVQRCHLQAEGLNSLFPWQLHVWMQGVPL